MSCRPCPARAARCWRAAAPGRSGRVSRSSWTTTGALALMIGNGEELVTVSTGLPCCLEWAFVAASYDATTGDVVLWQEPDERFVTIDAFAHTSARRPRHRLRRRPRPPHGRLAGRLARERQAAHGRPFQRPHRQPAHRVEGGDLRRDVGDGAGRAAGPGLAGRRLGFRPRHPDRPLSRPLGQPAPRLSGQPADARGHRLSLGRQRTRLDPQARALRRHPLSRRRPGRRRMGDRCQPDDPRRLPKRRLLRALPFGRRRVPTSPSSCARPRMRRRRRSPSWPRPRPISPIPTTTGRWTRRRPRSNAAASSPIRPTSCSCTNAATSVSPPTTPIRTARAWSTARVCAR